MKQFPYKIKKTKKIWTIEFDPVYLAKFSNLTVLIFVHSVLNQLKRYSPARIILGENSEKYLEENSPPPPDDIFKLHLKTALVHYLDSPAHFNSIGVESICPFLEWTLKSYNA